MIETPSRLHNIIRHRLSAPLMLLALSVVCYGLYLGWMGFYWDDWPSAWAAHISDSYGIRFFQFQRPLSGWVISLIAFVIDEVPLRWQIVTLGIRLASALAVWQVVSTIWPRYRNGAFAVAALFLVFPGFSQQFVSVNSAPHLVALILFTLSLVFMVRAERPRQPSWPLRLFAIGTAFVSMMTTDYYYGLELARPLVIWLSWKRDERKLGDLVKASLPYLILLVAIFLWRDYISRYGAYSLNLLDSLRADPVTTLSRLAVTVEEDLVIATWGVWSRIFSWPSEFVTDNRVVLYYIILVLGTSGTLFAYLHKMFGSENQSHWGRELTVLGAITLLFGGIAFWVPGLPFRMAFPADRLMLPMMLGSSLLLAGLVEWLARPPWAKTVLLSALVGLAVGAHFFNALSYRLDWQAQRDFYNQLTWRIPGLVPGTTLVSEELPFEYVTDNSITAVLNWIYAPDFSVPNEYYDWEYRIDPFTDLPYMLRYLDLRLGWQLPPLEDEAEYEAPYRFFRFRGSSGQILLIHYDRQACLKIYDPVFDEGNPDLEELSSLAEYALGYSEQELIVSDPQQNALLPPFVVESDPSKDWCYYFESAQLARQQGDWAAIMRMGVNALEIGPPRTSISDAVVFIEGYAMGGDWQSAATLSNQVGETDPALSPMLCATWARVEQASHDMEVQAAAVTQLARLTCP